VSLTYLSTGCPIFFGYRTVLNSVVRALHLTIEIDIMKNVNQFDLIYYCKLMYLVIISVKLHTRW